MQIYESLEQNYIVNAVLYKQNFKPILVRSDGKDYELSVIHALKKHQPKYVYIQHIGLPLLNDPVQLYAFLTYVGSQIGLGIRKTNVHSAYLLVVKSLRAANYEFCKHESNQKNIINVITVNFWVTRVLQYLFSCAPSWKKSSKAFLYYLHQTGPTCLMDMFFVHNLIEVMEIRITVSKLQRFLTAMMMVSRIYYDCGKTLTSFRALNMLDKLFFTFCIIDKQSRVNEYRHNLITLLNQCRSETIKSQLVVGFFVQHWFSFHTQQHEITSIVYCMIIKKRSDVLTTFDFCCHLKKPILIGTELYKPKPSFPTKFQLSKYTSMIRQERDGQTILFESSRLDRHACVGISSNSFRTLHITMWPYTTSGHLIALCFWTIPKHTNVLWHYDKVGCYGLHFSPADREFVDSITYWSSDQKQVFHFQLLHLHNQLYIRSSNLDARGNIPKNHKVVISVKCAKTQIDIN
jgi:hypothetical protein